MARVKLQFLSWLMVFLRSCSFLALYFHPSHCALWAHQVQSEPLIVFGKLFPLTSEPWPMLILPWRILPHIFYFLVPQPALPLASLLWPWACVPSHCTRCVWRQELGSFIPNSSHRQGFYWRVWGLRIFIKWSTTALNCFDQCKKNWNI